MRFAFSRIAGTGRHGGWPLIVVLLVAAGWGLPASARAESPLEYNRDVRPILAENCFACHGADSAARKAELRLDQRDAAVDFGAIVPGKPEQSALLERVLSNDADSLMPPPETKKTLTVAEKAILKRWITEGAAYQPHWSFMAPTRPELPKVKNAAWGKNAIDRFVLANLEEAGLSPAPQAEPRTLFRRLHLDVTGLPPSPEDMEAFVRDFGQRGDVALSEWIDRLMKSPAWGEHRGRYWLDAARYGDTHGLHFDNYREMWPYRDWVIRSFNANQPFDRFTVEQIAGDLLENPSEDQLIATGFQRCNITTNEGGTIDAENLANYAADRVQTFGWVYLGLTTNCAQCHDHKFDPITQHDYYSLAAFFRNTTQGPKDGNVKDGRGPLLVLPAEADKERWKSLPGEIAAAKSQLEQHKRQAQPKFEAWIAKATAAGLEEQLPSDELILHVPLVEGQGDEIQSLGESPATHQATGSIEWQPNGKLGSAAVLKSGSTFELGDLADLEKDQAFSYGAWVRTAKADAMAAILARMDEGAAHRGWDLWQNGAEFAVHIVDTWPSNAIKVSTQGAAGKPGQWQHVLMTYDGSGKPAGVRIYVNGKEQKLKVDQGSLKANASIRAKTPLRIGQRSRGSVFEGGSVQDVRIYGRQLTASEVGALSGIAELAAILGRDPSKRTAPQQAALLEHYLTVQDDKHPALAKAVVDLEAELEAIRARSPITHIQEEKPGSQAMANILMRGEYDRPADEVEAAPPAFLHPLSEGAPRNRLGLALWLVDSANPLTARVTVNRFWQQVFGRGLVTTSEDFGVMGALPSHPELLDWLALDFQENGWDVKRQFKQMLMSATYRQAALTTAEKLDKDRDNLLLSRGPRFRMDGEMLRDVALASSGLLSSKMYGPGVKPYQPEALWDIVGLPGGDTRKYVQDHGEDLYRRSLYTFWKRMSPPPNLEVFNAPSREVCAVRRERTNTPLQALVTLNDPQFVEAARRLAELALGSAGTEDQKALPLISERVLGRSFNDREQAILLADRAEYLAYYQANAADAQALIAIGESEPQAGLDPAVLAAWTMVCNQVLNLDEALNK